MHQPYAAGACPVHLLVREAMAGRASVPRGTDGTPARCSVHTALLSPTPPRHLASMGPQGSGAVSGPHCPELHNEREEPGSSWSPSRPFGEGRQGARSGAVLGPAPVGPFCGPSKQPAGLTSVASPARPPTGDRVLVHLPPRAHRPLGGDVPPRLFRAHSAGEIP